MDAKALNAVEQRTARLTLLIDPRKKALLERLSAEQDTTVSQLIRKLIRDYIEERTGRPWAPDAEPEPEPEERPPTG